MSDYETILVNEGDDGVVTITLNRPKRYNALTPGMADELLDAYTGFARSKPRVVILTGAGRAFCSGADLVSDMFQGSSPEEVGAYIDASMARSFNPMLQAFRALPCPTIARVNGVAAGGGASMALLADIVIAAESAYFTFPFTPRLGLVPDMSVTWTLPRLVGQARAFGLTFLGESLPAAKAAEWGLIWQAVADADLDAVIAATAARLAAAPTEALISARTLLDAAMASEFVSQLDREREAQTAMAALPYLGEGVAAFAEKREPNFHDI